MVFQYLSPPSTAKLGNGTYENCIFSEPYINSRLSCKFCRTIAQLTYFRSYSLCVKVEHIFMNIFGLYFWGDIPKMHDCRFDFFYCSLTSNLLQNAWCAGRHKHHLRMHDVPASSYIVLSKLFFTLFIIFEENYKNNSPHILISISKQSYDTS